MGADGRTMKRDDTAKGSRQDRLKLALRENLRRRKGQLRGRSNMSGEAVSDSAEDDGPSRDRPGDAAKPET